MRRLSQLALVLMLCVPAVAGAGAAEAKTPGSNGRIAFFRNNPTDSGPNTSYTINPDGTGETFLFADADSPHWSPSGIELTVSCCGAAAVIVNPDTGKYRVLQSPDPSLPIGCSAWSPDGARLACGLVDDVDSSLFGIYTIRSSDGGGLTKVIGLFGGPGDYSPDGKRLVFTTDTIVGEPQLYVVKLNGSGLTQITPTGTILGENAGSWSPTGNHILFSARTAPDHRLSIWEVNADGTGLYQVPIPGCGGALSDARSHGCYDPTWSPDGSKIAFARNSDLGHLSNIYTANADGSGLFQVTRGAYKDFGPDWGTHPVAP